MLMQTPQPAEVPPLTHSGYMKACQQLAMLGTGSVKPWIQVRKRFGGVPLVLCGQAIELDAGSDSGEWFKVHTDMGTLWIESRHARMCSGDGRCTCELDLEKGDGRRGVPHRAPLPGARQADWRSGRAEVCPPPPAAQELGLASGQGAV